MPPCASFEYLDVLEFEIAQVDRQSDGREQRSGLRQVTHHFAARADQRDIEGQQHEDDRSPARRPARLLAARLQPFAAGVKTFGFALGFFGIGLSIGRASGSIGGTSGGASAIVAGSGSGA